ncbi:MAG: dihydrodipicolinate synthase family protein [Trebonia sp.]
MDRNDVSWQGYWAACPTPYGEAGELRLDLLESLIEHYIAHGLHGILINGTTGEWFSQTAAERRTVAQTAIACVADRIPVVISCSDYTAAAVIELAEHAMSIGASGFAASAPAYSRPLDSEIVAFYEDISSALPAAPLMLYNWPSGTNVDFSPELCATLVDIESVVALKNSTGDFERFTESTRLVIDRARVFGPFMGSAGYRTLTEIGGDGFIGGGAILDEADPRFWDAHWTGDTAYCEAHAARTDRIFDRLWLPGGWRGRFGHYQSQLKAIMAMLGQPGGTVRPPRLPVTDPDALRQIRAILVEEQILTTEQAA